MRCGNPLDECDASDIVGAQLIAHPEPALSPERDRRSRAAGAPCSLAGKNDAFCRRTTKVMSAEIAWSNFRQSTQSREVFLNGSNAQALSFEQALQVLP